ncbi:MAG: extracellular solute-binding protein [Clostridia bacterium]|nr:extracellular solute-binding protein [Clostridia bacterium]
MKKITKIISLACATALAASVFAACGKKEEKTTASVDHLTYWSTMDGSASITLKNYSEMLFFQELEKLTGVKVEFIHPIAGSTGNEAFVAMLTNQELPDMLEYNWSSYSGGAQQAIDDDVIISLNDYLKDYAPNYYDYMYGEKAKTNDYLYKLQTVTPDGRHYGFNVLNIGNSRVFDGLVIRGDLLKKWGMDMPETIDEWTAILAKAKAEGFEKPLTGIIYDISFIGSTPYFNSAFNVGKYYYVEDGKVVYAPFQKGFKEYVAQMADWCKAGYIDTGIITNDGAKVEGNLANDISIAAVRGIGGGIGKIVPAVREKNPDYTLVACPYPVPEKGTATDYIGMSAEATSLAISITRDCRDIESALKWCDARYSEEGSILQIFGVEGDTYTIEDRDGEKHYVYTDKILNFKENGYNSVSEAIFKYALPANHPGLNQHPDYLDGYYPLDEQKQALEVWNKDLQEARAHLLPTLTFTEEEAREKTDILEVADAELEVAINDIILGKKSIDTYDAAIEKALDSGFDRVLEIYQAAYDRYMINSKK